jgi:A/G-specific adenine glycosylase
MAGMRPSTSSVQPALLAWYQGVKRDLPWRRTRDPYAILLSELMLQQTRVQTALPYYDKFLAKWPTFEALAAAPEDEVLRAWAGLGYYSRARNLLAAARACVAEHGGTIPPDEAAVRALPGVGPYTAGAVLSICHAKPLPAVDGNVVRVLSRLFRIEDADPRREVDRRAAALVPADAPGEWNQAVMELGATLCSPRNPRCEACPVERFCAARAAGVAEELPRKAKKKASPEADVAVALCRRADGRTLLVRRPEKGLLAGMWAPPSAEGDGRALELAFPGLKAGGALGTWTHRFTHRVWRCAAYDCAAPRHLKGSRWVEESELDAVPTAFRPALSR